MVRILLTLIFSLIIISCSRNNYKTIDFGSFKITVPDDWNKYERSGIDSYIGGIVTDKLDTLNFDFGWYSGDISNSFPLVFDKETLKELSSKKLALLSDTKHLIMETWSDSNIEIDLNDYRKYDVHFDSIDCFNAKIILPRNKGFGSSGIFIDRMTVDGKLKFNFYGNFLDNSTQQKFLKALKTLKFDICSERQ